ncbi:MAG: lactate racemase domain-containing protein [Planctomycetia bacterium]|nr:lactate racemase domain-containing protein [Planctomycetia bacterium]
MSVRSSAAQSLRYGEGQLFQFDLEPNRIVRRHRPPEPSANFVADVREQLQEPLNFPPLELAIVPEDKIAIALDRQTPGAAQVIAGMWAHFERRSVRPEDVTILQPASWQMGKLPDPRSALPDSVRDQVKWVVHDATDKKREVYLANSAGGERIYLAREIVDADVILPVGSVGFDPLLGIRNASSAIYPGLSNVDAMAKARGQDHSELRPEDDRPLRQLQDEVAWLLGVQMGVQVLPGVGGQPAGLLCGALDAVTTAGRIWLKQNWYVELPQRCEVVVAAVDADGGETSWEHIGAALQTARNLVQRRGKIVLISSLAAEPSEGFAFLRQSETPREALKPLRIESPPDLIPASRLASAADWATVYLLSQLNSDVVESHCMTPLASELEVVRLLERSGSCLLLEGAQHTFGYVA